MSNYGLEILDREQCATLLRTQQVGRVGVCSGLPAVLPVLYAMLDQDIVFRTAPGEKLIAAALHREVVFEIDEFNIAERSGWSVNVLGSAEEITDSHELARVEALDLHPWAGELRDRVVRIRAKELSGRRIRPDA